LAHNTIDCAWAGVASDNIAIAEKMIGFIILSRPESNRWENARSQIRSLKCP
jgi:hypothetical protein